MSTTTLKLPFKRFVAQVSSAPARSKSSYLSLMAENLEELKKCPWREAVDVPATLTGHDFTASTQFSDAYDAYKLTGNYETANMTEIAYAGMAAYRFRIPESAMNGSGVPVASVSLPVSRDRFLKDGLHVSAALSNSAEPSADWETVRGSGDLAASAVLAQDAATLMDGSADATTVTLDLSGVSSGNPAAYLWVYVTLEDYTDHWTMYSAKEKRLYAVEGSAMLAGDVAEVTFGGAVAADAAPEGQYVSCKIPVRVTCWMWRQVATLRFRALCWEGIGKWRHLEPAAEWTVSPADMQRTCEFSLDTAGRKIRPGPCILECWAGDGDFVPGMPYGCAHLGDLSRHAAPARADVELTLASPVMMRVDIADGIGHAGKAATDRGKLNGRVGNGGFETFSEFQTWNEEYLDDYNVTSPVRVRVVRLGTSQANNNRAVLVDRYLALPFRRVMTEADVISEGSYDLNFSAGDAVIQNQSVKSARFYIQLGEGDLETGEGYYGNIVPVLFINAYDAPRVKTVPASPVAGAVAGGADGVRFRWKHPDAVKAYPAFRLCIFDVDTNNVKGHVLYDSGVLRAPVRDEDGMYEWLAPIHAGDATLVDGVTFAAGWTYYWTVSMLDAKWQKIFTTDNNTTQQVFDDKTAFTL